MPKDRASEFERISQPVLRAYLHSMGWQPGDYRVTQVQSNLPAERHPARLASNCKSMSGDVEGQLTVALLLDQLHASPEYVATALPAELLEENAIACVLLARALQRAGKHDEALTRLFDAVSLDPTAGSVRKTLGLELRRQGQLEQATFHLEEAMELRTDIRLHSQLHPNVPVLVARPSQQFDIYLYQHRFYLMRRLPDSIGARPIGGELYGIRRSAVFKILRWLVRLPLLRPILLAMIRPFLPPPIAAPLDPKAPPQPTAPVPARWRVALSGLLRASAKRVALWTLARPMERVDTMGAAVERARTLSKQAG